MWQRRRTWLIVIALTGVAFAVYFEPTHCVRGWLRGDAFFEGRPTSYWRAEMTRDLHMDPDTFNKSDAPKWWVRCMDWIGVRPSMTGSTRLIENEQAACILQAVTGDSDKKLAGFAKDILKFHRRPRRALVCDTGGMGEVQGFRYLMIMKHNVKDLGWSDFYK